MSTNAPAAVIRVPSNALEPVEPENVPIIEAGDPCMVFATPDDNDVLIVKDHDAANAEEVLSREEEHLRAFANEANQYGEENPQVFEGMWQRFYLERQARLLEGQIHVQNQQQSKLVETLQEVARAIGKGSPGVGGGAAADVLYPRPPGSHQGPLQYQTASNNIAQQGQHQNDADEKARMEQRLADVQEEVKMELENSKRELLAQVEHSRKDLESMVQNMESVGNIKPQKTSAASGRRAPGVADRVGRQGRRSKTTQQGEQLDANEKRPSRIPGPPSGRQGQHEAAGNGITKSPADGSSQFAASTSSSKTASTAGGQPHAAAGGQQKTAALTAKRDQVKQHVNASVFSELADRLFPSKSSGAASSVDDDLLPRSRTENAVDATTSMGGGALTAGQAGVVLSPERTTARDDDVAAGSRGASSSAAATARKLPRAATTSSQNKRSVNHSFYSDIKQELSTLNTKSLTWHEDEAAKKNLLTRVEERNLRNQASKKARNKQPPSVEGGTPAASTTPRAATARSSFGVDIRDYGKNHPAGVGNIGSKTFVKLPPKQAVTMSTARPSHLRSERTEVVKKALRGAADAGGANGGVPGTCSSRMLNTAPNTAASSKHTASAPPNQDGAAVTRNNLATKVREKPFHPDAQGYAHVARKVDASDQVGCQLPVTKPQPFSFDVKPPLDAKNTLLLSQPGEAEEVLDDAAEAAAMVKLVREREEIENAKRMEELEKLRAEAAKAQAELQKVLKANAQSEMHEELRFDRYREYENRRAGDEKREQVERARSGRSWSRGSRRSGSKTSSHSATRSPRRMMSPTSSGGEDYWHRRDHIHPGASPNARQHYDPRADPRSRSSSLTSSMNGRRNRSGSLKKISALKPRSATDLKRRASIKQAVRSEVARRRAVEEAAVWASKNGVDRRAMGEVLEGFEKQAQDAGIRVGGRTCRNRSASPQCTSDTGDAQSAGLSAFDEFLSSPGTASVQGRRGSGGKSGTNAKDDYYFFTSPPSSSNAGTSSHRSPLGSARRSARNASAKSNFSMYETGRVRDINANPTKSASSSRAKAKQKQSSRPSRTPQSPLPNGPQYYTPEELLLRQKTDEYNEFAERLKRKYNIAGADIGETRAMLRAATEYSRVLPRQSTSTEYSPLPREPPPSGSSGYGPFAGYDYGAVQRGGGTALGPAAGFSGAVDHAAWGSSPAVVPPQSGPVRCNAPRMETPAQPSPTWHGLQEQSLFTPLSVAQTPTPTVPAGPQASTGLYVTDLKLLECLNSGQGAMDVEDAEDPADIMRRIDEAAALDTSPNTKADKKKRPASSNNVPQVMSSLDRESKNFAVFRQVLHEVLAEETMGGSGASEVEKTSAQQAPRPIEVCNITPAKKKTSVLAARGQKPPAFEDDAPPPYEAAVDLGKPSGKGASAPSEEMEGSRLSKPQKQATENVVTKENLQSIVQEQMAAQMALQMGKMTEKLMEQVSQEFNERFAEKQANESKTQRFAELLLYGDKEIRREMETAQKGQAVYAFDDRGKIRKDPLDVDESMTSEASGSLRSERHDRGEMSAGNSKTQLSTTQRSQGDVGGDSVGLIADEDLQVLQSCALSEGEVWDNCSEGEYPVA
mmetsp:Transcript_17054/g.42291  ORF Transcript_17054/g.42291 Transcript_17054/m.42291 type:complete len:1598 (+) Transcript_17054:64-4857(+)|eukprot:CAMPEP_0178985468 /NCGR_PEP_ID=MMETSP0795-20121207/2171_1 /TAXON_ID=88552 /ORGANISM="Amoebophrya sp., Strain Ameob2" /LENGTH=1597 /DNA_ID=CAMNT_0020676433 /DNA_START=28 /DNA_END=4821 /DNA_ORIENTATION=+